MTDRMRNFMTGVSIALGGLASSEVREYLLRDLNLTESDLDLAKVALDRISIAAYSVDNQDSSGSPS